MFVTTDEDGRICCTSTTGSAENGDDELDFPEGFDFLAQRDWRIVDGELVHDPLPPDPGERIAELKAKLSETDYVVVKLMEASLGKASIDQADAERYDGIISDRQAWRDEINELEGGE